MSLYVRHLNAFRKICNKTGTSLPLRAIICENCQSKTHICNSSSLIYRSSSHFANEAKTDNYRFLGGIQSPVGITYKHLQREAKALGSILDRSGLHQPRDILQLCFGGSRSFSTSASREQQRDDQRDGRRNEDDPDKDPNEEEKMPFVARMMLTFWLAVFVYAVFRVQNADETAQFKYISWNEFYHEMLAKGEVEEIMVRPEAEVAFIKLHQGAIVKNSQSDVSYYTMKIAEPFKFEEKIRKAESELGVRPEKGIPISYQRESSWAPVIFLGIAALVLFAIFRNVKIQMPNPMDMFAGERKAKFVRADLMTQSGKPIGFKDVAGLHEAKVEINEFVDYIRRPEKYTELGGKAPRGALLLGPPGCGKTLLAKALASEAKVPFLAMAGSEFVEMLGGLGAARVRDLFKEARKKAPCIIYIDEIDAIGRKRSGDNWAQNTEEEHTLNQLLVEMDGMETQGGVIMLGSTNRADVLDKALLRPGRFDRHIMIDLPTVAERRELYDMYLRRLALASLPATFTERLAQLSPGMTGADVANVANEAALHAARESRTAVIGDDFEYAIERVTAGVAKKSRVLSQSELRIVAYHEAGHALVGWLLEHTDPLLRVSIIPRTSSALGFAQYLPSDNKLHSKEELFEMMCMALGGRVAESLTFNRVTSGAMNDLEKVTAMAYSQIRHLGMNERVGTIAFPPTEGGSGARPYSKQLTQLMDEEARLMVARAYQFTEKVLTDNKEKLRAIAEALLAQEALTYKDVEQLIGPPKYLKAEIPGFDS